MAGVTFDGVGKVYPDGTRAVSDGLEIRDGEFMVLVGPSGCGKTTALRMVAGLEEISEGVVKIGDRVVNHVASRDRDIAMVFQSYALYPHLSVYDNIAFGLKLRKENKGEIDKRVKEAARSSASSLSSSASRARSRAGSDSAVAMGRAIVRRPQAFLMDEPLEPRRQAPRPDRGRDRQAPERSRNHRDLRDPRPGRGHDDGRPRRGHAQGAAAAGSRSAGLRPPVNLFVGGFIGSPAMNMIEATLAKSNGGFAVEAGGQRIALSQELLANRPALSATKARTIVLGIRPEDLEDAALAPRRSLRAAHQGNVELTEALGSEIMAHFTIDAPPALTEDVRELAQDVGDERAVEQHEDAQHLMVGRFGARSQVKTGRHRRGLRGHTRPAIQSGLGIYDDTRRTNEAWPCALHSSDLGP